MLIKFPNQSGKNIFFALFLIFKSLRKFEDVLFLLFVLFLSSSIPSEVWRHIVFTLFIIIIIKSPK